MRNRLALLAVLLPLAVAAQHLTMRVEVFDGATTNSATLTVTNRAVLGSITAISARSGVGSNAAERAILLTKRTLLNMHNTYLDEAIDAQRTAIRSTAASQEAQAAAAVNTNRVQDVEQ